MAVLGPTGWAVLRRIGVPTLIEIDLRLSACLPSDRKGLATDMFREWTRVACNGHEWSAPIDCSFCLFTDIPAAWVVDHSHPTELKTRTALFEFIDPPTRSANTAHSYRWRSTWDDPLTFR